MPKRRPVRNVRRKIVPVLVPEIEVRKSVNTENGIVPVAIFWTLISGISARNAMNTNLLTEIAELVEVTIRLIPKPMFLDLMTGDVPNAATLTTPEGQNATDAGLLVVDDWLEVFHYSHYHKIIIFPTLLLTSPQQPKGKWQSLGISAHRFFEWEVYQNINRHN